MFNTPVLLLIFNRLETTKLVFEAIRQRQPAFLYIAADGPRTNKEGEKEITDFIRNYVIKNIDWDCEVKTLFRQENLGCGRAVSEAISWFFENVEQGIILEDDCLPDPSFFPFCEELLHYYKKDNEIFHISGNNFQDNGAAYKYSYYYSKYPNSWGWASWRRAWKDFDFKLNHVDYKRKLQHINFFDKERKWFFDSIDDIRNGDYLHTWDFQWLLCNLNKKAIIPSKNLVKNIGFGKDATHTFSETDSFLIRERNSIEFPLAHNPLKEYDQIKDKYLYFNTTYLWRKRGLVFKLISQTKYYIKKLKSLQWSSIALKNEYNI